MAMVTQRPPEISQGRCSTALGPGHLLPQGSARSFGPQGRRWGAGEAPGQAGHRCAYSVMRLASSVQAAVELAEKTR